MFSLLAAGLPVMIGVHAQTSYFNRGVVDDRLNGLRFTVYDSAGE